MEIDKCIPSLPGKRNVTTIVKTIKENDKELEIEWLKEKFEDLDSQIVNLENEQTEVLEKLEQKGISKCSYCFEWNQINEMLDYDGDFVCKECQKIDLIFKSKRGD